MGTFSVEIETGSPDRSTFRKIETLVDTGATFSWFPRSLLEQLGHRATTRKSFEIGDGGVVERDVGQAPIRIGGEELVTVCVFADNGEQPVLGAVTLEEFLLAPDPVNKRLVPVVGIHIARRFVL